MITAYSAVYIKSVEFSKLGTVEPHFNKDLGTMKIILLYQWKKIEL